MDMTVQVIIPTAVLAMLFGFMLAKFIEERGTEKTNFEEKEKNETERSGPFTADSEGGEPDPMTLRNGYGVTRDKKPTLAEQWVNIMNYSGENQTEDGYEEENDNPEGYME